MPLETSRGEAASKYIIEWGNVTDHHYPEPHHVEHHVDHHPVGGYFHHPVAPHAPGYFAKRSG